MRELEGLLDPRRGVRVAAGAADHLEFAQETLKNFLTQAAHSLTVEAVQKEVANYFNVKLTDIKSAKRHQVDRAPARRSRCTWRASTCKDSYPDLARAFGGKDHTTVMSAVPEDRSSWSRSDPKTAPHASKSSSVIFRSERNSVAQLVGTNVWTDLWRRSVCTRSLPVHPLGTLAKSDDTFRHRCFT